MCVKTLCATVKMRIYKDKIMGNASGTPQTFTPESGFKIPSLWR